MDCGRARAPHRGRTSLALRAGRRRSIEDPALGFYCTGFHAAPAARPHRARFRVAIHNPGFVNSQPNTDIVHNGSFVNDRYLPLYRIFPGYRTDRRQHPPPSRPGKSPAPAETRGCGRAPEQRVSFDADWVKFEARSAPAPDQIAILPATCRRNGCRTAAATSITRWTRPSWISTRSIRRATPYGATTGTTSTWKFTTSPAMSSISTR